MIFDSSVLLRSHVTYLSVFLCPQSVKFSVQTLFFLQDLLTQRLHVLIGQSLLIQQTLQTLQLTQTNTIQKNNNHYSA